MNQAVQQDDHIQLALCRVKHTLQKVVKICVLFQHENVKCSAACVGADGTLRLASQQIRRRNCFVDLRALRGTPP